MTKKEQNATLRKRLARAETAALRPTILLYRKAAQRWLPSSEEVDRMCQILSRIKDQATRRLRANANKEYLLTDLEIITDEVKKALELVDKP